VSIQTDYDLYITDIAEFIEIIKAELRCFENFKINTNSNDIYVKTKNYVVFSCSPISNMCSKFKNEDYGVEVNYTLTFNHYSDLSVNSPESIIKFVCRLINLYNTDCLFSHNGGDPLLIRKNNKIELADDSRYNFSMGNGSKNTVITLLNDLLYKV